MELATIDSVCAVIKERLIAGAEVPGAKKALIVTCVPGDDILKKLFTDNHKITIELQPTTVEAMQVMHSTLEYWLPEDTL